MFTDTFDPSQVYKVYVVQSQRKSSLSQNPSNTAVTDYNQMKNMAHAAMWVPKLMS